MDTRNARLFLALWPGASERADMVDALRPCRWPRGAAIYGSADWHVTVHFLGAVPRESMPSLLDDLAIAVKPFQLTLDDLQIWPGGLVVWLPRVVPPEFVELHQRLAGRLQAVGLPVAQRVFRPHLTLARKASGFVPPSSLPTVTLVVPGYALLQSTGDPAERYRVLQFYQG